MDYFNRLLETLYSYKHLGYRQLPGGTRLIGHVPHVAPDAWLHEIYCPINNNDIEELEAKLAFRLPRIFQDFLKLSNGLNLFSDTISIAGYIKFYERKGDDARQPYSLLIPNVHERLPDSKKSYLYIGSYSWDGSLLYIDKSNNKVFRCLSDSSEPFNEWDSFWVMVLSEAQRISKLFDNKGRVIIPNQAPTP
jgi:hypothetical protein